MKKIVHIITSTGDGGAQMMLFRLLEKIDKKKYEIEVVSMMNKGLVAEKIESLGIKVHSLSMKRGIPNLSSMRKAISICKNVDIIQSWTYHADLLSFVVGKVFLNKKVIWGIHHSNLEKNKNKRNTLLVVKINSIFSKKIDKIISCSKTATKVHIDYGFCRKNIVTIPNGFSLDKYKFIDRSKIRIINELKLDPNKMILSLVGRWDVLKDHKGCLDALELLKNKRDNFIMIFCEKGIDEKNIELKEMIYKRKLQDHVILLGRREDIPEIMSATDIYISSSSGEGFPNVIGEAMACEAPCVVTDVGDSAYIVGETGIVVPRQNPKALAEGIDKLLDMTDLERKKLGKDARKRILDNFEISNIVSLYENLYI